MRTRITFGALIVTALVATAHVPVSAEVSREPAPPLEWGTCPDDPIIVNGERFITWSSGGGECATLSVALDGQRPDDQMIELFVARYRTTAEPARRQGQLLLLDGGPGGTGAAFTPGVEGASLARFRADGWDLVVPVHRGTGRSTELRCHTVDDLRDVRRCGARLDRKWGKALGAFGPVDAARDVCAVASLLRHEGGRTAIYGISYGTFLAQQVVALCEPLVDALVLDGVMPHDVSFDELPAAEDAFARRLLESCAADLTCNTKLDGDPLAALTDVFTRAAAGTLCPALPIPAASLKSALMSVVGSGDQAPVLVPALIHRLRRCEPHDVAAIQTLVSRLESGAQSLVRPLRVVEGRPLGLNASCIIFRSHSTLSAAELAAREAEALLSSADASSNAARCQVWPRLSAPAFPTLSHPSLPTLMLQGEFDPRTLLAWAQQTARTFDGPFQSLVVVPTGRHGTVPASGMMSANECPIAIMAEFLQQPTAPLDTRCLKPLAIDWSGRGERARALALTVFGVTDLWGGEDPLLWGGEDPLQR